MLRRRDHRGLDDALLALPHSLRALDELAADRGALTRAAAAARRVVDDLRDLEAERARLAAEHGREFGRSDEVFELAKRYCALSAAAACVHLFVHSRDVSEPTASGALLLLCLERLSARSRPLERLTGPDDVDAVASLAESLHRDCRLFSSLPITLASAGVPDALTSP